MRQGSTLLIQQVYQGSEYVDLLSLTAPRHLNYARSFGMDYQVIYGNVCEELEMKMGGWAKLLLLRAALAAGYEYIVWVDADAVISDLHADLRDGCPKAGGLGMTINTQPYNHYNVGMIYARVCPALGKFMEEWISWYPGPQGWHEQAVLNLLVRVPEYSRVVTPIDYRYNSCKAGGTHVDNAVVEAFHGEGAICNRLRLMQDYLKEK